MLDNKKIVISILTPLLLLGATSVHAQSVLPPAGLTPDSPFYFLDRFFENVQEMFTTNPEARARLEIRFAGERAAEIKKMVTRDTVTLNDAHINEAKASLMANITQATTILKNEKNKGKNVSQLANEINTSFDAQEQLLVKTFQDARNQLHTDRVRLLAQNGTPVSATNTPVATTSQKTLDAAVVSKQLAAKAKSLAAMQSNIVGLFNEKQAPLLDQLSQKQKEQQLKRDTENELKNKIENKKIEQNTIDTNRESEKPEGERKSTNSSGQSNEGENSKGSPEGKSAKGSEGGDSGNSQSNHGGESNGLSGEGESGKINIGNATRGRYSVSGGGGEGNGSESNGNGARGGDN